MNIVDVKIPLAAETISARYFPAACDELASAAGRPCVVMAHGIGATRDSGLDGFATALADAGADVVAFDYRHFAESSGEPRQLVSIRQQWVDYRTVVDYARHLDGVDATRIIIWGVSLAGGHVIKVAADDLRIAGVVALTPAVDGLPVVANMLRVHGVGYTSRVFARGLRDLVAHLRGRPPVLAPIVGRPGEVAALSTPGAVEGMLAIAGPSWRNEFAARLVLAIGAYRPITDAHRVACPALVQIGDIDRIAPPESATLAATRMKATVHHYPCDHFDVYPGAPWHQRVVADQVAFLRRIAEPREHTS